MGIAAGVGATPPTVTKTQNQMMTMIGKMVMINKFHKMTS